MVEPDANRREKRLTRLHVDKHVIGSENKPLSKCKSGPPRILAVGTENSRIKESERAWQHVSLTHYVEAHEIAADGLRRDLTLVH